MYCGNNKVALSSQRQIAQALMQLIDEKPYQDITISELCKTAGISRQTFYTLFTSRENVVTFTLQEQYGYAPEEEADPCGSSLSHLCSGYSTYITSNRDFLRMLVENHIEYLLYDSIHDALSDCPCFLHSVPNDRRQYAADFYAGGITGVVKRYALSGCRTSSAELADILYDLFGGSCFS